MTPDQQAFHDAMTGKDKNVFTCPWMERIKECRERGYMLGLLEGLKYQVDERTRKKIEEFLAGIKE